MSLVDATYALCMLLVLVLIVAGVDRRDQRRLRKMRRKMLYREVLKASQRGLSFGELSRASRKVQKAMQELGITLGNFGQGRP